LSSSGAFTIVDRLVKKSVSNGLQDFSCAKSPDFYEILIVGFAVRAGMQTCKIIHPGPLVHAYPACGQDRSRLRLSPAAGRCADFQAALPVRFCRPLDFLRRME